MDFFYSLYISQMVNILHNIFFCLFCPCLVISMVYEFFVVPVLSPFCPCVVIARVYVIGRYLYVVMRHKPA